MTVQKRGFTLIEILVVITIMAVLLAAGVATYTSVIKKSRDAKRRSDIGQIQQALEMFRADVLEYPHCPNDDSAYQDIATCLNVAVGPAPANVPFSQYLPTRPSDPKVSSDFHYYYRRPTTTTYFVTAFVESDATSHLAPSCPTMEGPYGSVQYCVGNP
jgi:type II secretion system protein G